MKTIMSSPLLLIGLLGSSVLLASSVGARGSRGRRSHSTAQLPAPPTDIEAHVFCNRR